MIIFDEIIQNGSGLYLIAESNEVGTKTYLTRLLVPSTIEATFAEWKQIFDGTIKTYALDFEKGAAAITYIDPNFGPEPGPIPSMMKMIEWDKVRAVKYLGYDHRFLYDMIIEAGSTIQTPIDPEAPVEG